MTDQTETLELMATLDPGQAWMLLGLLFNTLLSVRGKEANILGILEVEEGEC